MMNLNKMSTLVLSLIMAGSALGGTVKDHLTRDILCHGQNKSTHNALFTVVGNVKSNTLSISRGEDDYDSQTLKITNVIPMFPVYSIDAKADYRAVDGPLVIARLNIRNEAKVIGIESNHATLVITTSSDRHAEEYVETFQLICQFKN
jgi:hypothetical protein